MKKNIRILKFFFVALVTLLSEITLFTILISILGLNPIIASPLGQVFGVIINFTLNKLFTFQVGKKLIWGEIWRYALVWIANVLISTMLLSILLSFIDIHPSIIRVFIIGVMFFFNYYAISRFVFVQKY
jgi:putative flippase GtrA